MARSRSSAALLVGSLFALAGPSTAESAPLRSSGKATVVSVDGPALLTVKVKQRSLRLRLFGVDAPRAGECGSVESVAALKRLTRPKRAMSYELRSSDTGRFARDTDGHYVGWLYPARSGFFGDSVGEELVATEWATTGTPLRPDEGPPDDEFHGSVMRGGSIFGAEAGGARPPRGLWAKCGGQAHLPLGAPAPPHASAPWVVNGDGVLESIGPIRFPSTLAPETALTVAQVAAVVPIELSDVDDGTCRVRVPSLELMLLAASLSATYPCGRADIYGAWATGPGKASTASGLAVGAAPTSASARFPRLVRAGTEGELLRLSGAGHIWPWQTNALLDDRGKVWGFAASTTPDNGEDT